MDRTGLPGHQERKGVFGCLCPFPRSCLRCFSRNNKSGFVLQKKFQVRAPHRAQRLGTTGTRLSPHPQPGVEAGPCPPYKGFCDSRGTGSQNPQPGIEAGDLPACILQCSSEQRLTLPSHFSFLQIKQKCGRAVWRGCVNAAVGSSLRPLRIRIDTEVRAGKVHRSGTVSGGILHFCHTFLCIESLAVVSVASCESSF